jgi:hypothetical protein
MFEIERAARIETAVEVMAEMCGIIGTQLMQAEEAPAPDPEKIAALTAVLDELHAERRALTAESLGKALYFYGPYLKALHQARSTSA